MAKAKKVKSISNGKRLARIKGVLPNRMRPGKRAKAAVVSGVYQIAVMATRLDSIKAMQVTVSDHYEVRGKNFINGDHAGMEALRRARIDHPSWQNLTFHVTG